MKLKKFREKMEKAVFSTTEAHIIGFSDDPRLINLQLHQWEKSGDIIRLKRGLYMFKEAKPKIAEIATNLYSPCYFSLEYALGLYSIMPEAVFTYTMITTKPTRTFRTPMGNFLFRKIKKEAFTGFDENTLMAEKEKALADYFYLNCPRLEADLKFWKETRLETAETGVDFKKVFRYARLFRSKKMLYLLKSFENYAKSY